MTLFGTSAKYIDAVAKAGAAPARDARPRAVRTMTSTGSPLAPESFDFVYDAIKRGRASRVDLGRHRHRQLLRRRQSDRRRSGGARFRRGARHGRRGLRRRRAAREGEKGELVCTTPFPSMPIGFWNDPDGGKYHAAYFERFPGVWHHGDYVELTEHDGRDHLRPLGCRAEPGRRPDRDGGDLPAGRAAARGPREPRRSASAGTNDERIVLFVRLRDGVDADDALSDASAHRSGAIPRRVTCRRASSQVTDIPRTKSGKIVELAVRDVVHGREVRTTKRWRIPKRSSSSSAVRSSRGDDGERVGIAAAVLEAVSAHARDEAPRECCGLLVGIGASIDEAVRTSNLEPGTTRYRDRSGRSLPSDQAASRHRA